MFLTFWYCSLRCKLMRGHHYETDIIIIIIEIQSFKLQIEQDLFNFPAKLIFY